MDDYFLPPRKKQRVEVTAPRQITSMAIESSDDDELDLYQANENTSRAAASMDASKIRLTDEESSDDDDFGYDTNYDNDDDLTMMGVLD